MTAATPGPSGPGIFSMFAAETDRLYRPSRETFFLSMLGQAAIVGVLIFLTTRVIGGAPPILSHFHPKDFPVIFRGDSGGGGGDYDPLPATKGDFPRGSLDPQLAPPTVILPKEMPKLPVAMTIVAPEVAMTPGAQVGDPMSQFTRALSNGPGGPGGIGTDCCDGDGSSKGPNGGNGPPGIHKPGVGGVTVPQVIYSPEPTFSEEARKSHTQGVVTLLPVVGGDGHPYNIRVGQSLGMGLDSQAIEAVNHWRFRPATLNGQPVPTQIAVEVQFHLY
jgi:periplasmic protein TonB